MTSQATTRLAALLRRLADRLDPQPPAAPPRPPKQRERGPIEQVRARQDERMAEVVLLVERFREHDAGSGLAWWERWQLDLVRDMLELELEQREIQFGEIAARWER